MAQSPYRPTVHKSRVVVSKIAELISQTLVSLSPAVSNSPRGSHIDDLWFAKYGMLSNLQHLMSYGFTKTSKGYMDVQ